jgi:RNA polymerase sigma-70 factor (ECF subfamily)
MEGPAKYFLRPKDCRRAVVSWQMAAMVVDTEVVSDAILIGRAQNGDREAFGQLVERHYAYIHRVAWRCSGNRTDAEDIAQDVCVRLGRTIGSYRGGSSFTTWLYAVTLNAARDLRRRAERETQKSEAFGLHAVCERESGGLAPAEDPADRLWAAVRTLPTKQKEAVLLVYGEGLAHAQAADVMGCAEPTVSWHIHEAKKRLKRMLRSAGAD